MTSNKKSNPKPDSVEKKAAVKKSKPLEKTEVTFPIQDKEITFDRKTKMPLDAFLRHCAIIGSSGSGKTVTAKMLCEEYAMRGIPVIAIDPQGDIASLILASTEKVITKRKGDITCYKLFKENVEVVIWTPTSAAGIPIFLNPLKFDFADKKTNEKIRAISAIAQSLTDLLGYDLKKDEGKYVSSFFDLVITYLDIQQKKIGSITGFVKFLRKMPDELAKETEGILPANKKDEILRKLRTLTIGSRKLLFNQGFPLDIKTLFGFERNSEDFIADNGPEPELSKSSKKLLYDVDDDEEEEKLELETATKNSKTDLGSQCDNIIVKKEAPPTRISVIYLNTLSTQEEKNFFVAQIATSLYNWMLSNPSKHLQGVFYIDEIAPFLPPVKKPASRDILRLLFKQSRKYGLSCLLATQNPGDVDYRSLSQVSNFFLGRLMTDQDIKKVNQMIKPLAGQQLDSIISKLPMLKPGEFLLLSPDNFADVRNLKIRWLYSDHKTLDEDDVEMVVTQEQRDYFDDLKFQLAQAEKSSKSINEDKSIGKSLSVSKNDSKAEQIMEPSKDKKVGSAKKNKKPASAKQLSENVELSKFSPADLLSSKSELESKQAREENLAKTVDAKPPKLTVDDKFEVDMTGMQSYFVDSVQSYTQDEVAKNLNFSKNRAVKLLKELETRGLIQKTKEGRKNVYFSSEYFFHHKLGMLEEIYAAKLKIGEIEAYHAAESEIDTSWMIAKNEEIIDSTLVYFPLWQCNFKGIRREGFLFFKREIPVMENVYMHPMRGRICFATKKGFVFAGAPKESDPIEIKDFDDFAEFARMKTSGKNIAIWALDNLLDVKEVKYQFDMKFNLKVHKLTLIFVPLWRFTLKKINSTKKREVFVDGILGKIFIP